MIKNKSLDEIVKNKELNERFISAKLDGLGIECNILQGNFFADTYSYFPITENFDAFNDLYHWQSPGASNHFFTKDFYDDFKKNINNYKTIEDVYLLGSSFVDNYYTNLIFFLPRLFFNNEDEIKLAVHRSLSNKFKEYILKVGSLLQKKITFVFLDNGMYKFKNSSIPQFINKKKSIEILRNFSKSQTEKVEQGTKLYVSRQNTNYRSIVNESDLIYFLKDQGFEIINPYNYKINRQFKIFASAEIIISPTGSNLANIIFCKKGTKIIEIGPDLRNSIQEKKYSKICELLNFNYFKINADTVNVDHHSSVALKYINKQILEKSSYYKNLIVKISDIKNFLANN